MEDYKKIRNLFYTGRFYTIVVLTAKWKNIQDCRTAFPDFLVQVSCTIAHYFQTEFSTGLSSALWLSHYTTLILFFLNHYIVHLGLVFRIIVLLKDEGLGLGNVLFTPDKLLWQKALSWFHLATKFLTSCLKDLQ